MSDGSNASSVDQLVIGANAVNSLFDEHGRLLIAEGVEITDALVESLRRRGITTLHLAGGKTGDAPRSSVRVVHQSSSDVALEQSIANDAVFGQLSTNYPIKKVERVRQQFVEGEKSLVHLHHSLGRSAIKSLGRTDIHVESFHRELSDDSDPVVAAAIAYDADLQLATRCVQFSILSMAIARQIGASKERIQSVGSAAMMHDWSLFDLPPESRFPHQPMTAQIREQYRVHSLSTVAMLDMVESVPPVVKSYVAQVHEMLDGSGFPNGLGRSEIDAMSRVLCVADAYLTLTSPPKGAPRIVPCDAVAFLVNGAAKGRYSSAAVRGLLQSVTLYPIGSIVELSDLTKAKVIRSNGSDYGYPIVESLKDATKIINLKQTELFVTRPVLVPDYREVRLTDTHVELNETIGRLNGLA